ncbi:MAG: helicase-related protein, partial [Candidatus Dojkabacteria bacterium]
VVASVSCIYGIGTPEDYQALAREVKVGGEYPRSKLISHLTEMQYYRSEYDFYPGLFRVRGDVIDIHLIAEEEALRVEYFGDEIESIKLINPVSGEVLDKPDKMTIYPAKQYVTPYDRIKRVLPQIREDLQKERADFEQRGKNLEAARLEQRVNFDLEMLEQIGFVSGIENYSRYLDGRPAGSAPSTLLDYFGEDWLLIVDESHMTIPQVRGMYNGDRMRKQALVDNGFRLRAALDNRPLKFNEFKERVKQTLYVSATPAEYELSSSKTVAEQIIRPTGLVDPVIRIRPSMKQTKENLLSSMRETEGFAKDAKDLEKEETFDQIDDLLQEVQDQVKQKQRTLITTLTKRMAEELSEFLEEKGLLVRYLHSDIDAIERVEILNSLRKGEIEVLVGINLLREGLDLPEVGLVAILDADKEGFLRSETSFIQTAGRAARNVQGKVIMYADKITGSMQRAIAESRRRRKIQLEYNEKHGITPKTVISEIKSNLQRLENDEVTEGEGKRKLSSWEKTMQSYPALKPKEKKKLRKDLEIEMEMLADALEFEKAAKIRDFLHTNK